MEQKNGSRIYISLVKQSNSYTKDVSKIIAVIFFLPNEDVKSGPKQITNTLQHLL